MSRFRYSALSRQGAPLHGWIEAASEAEAISCLQAQGHLPLRARPGRPGLLRLAWWRRHAPLSVVWLLQWTRQLATLLAAGQPLERALGVLIELEGAAPGQDLITRLRGRIRAGMPLSAALEAEQGGSFNRLYVSLVRAGEASGRLDDSLRHLAGYMERTQAWRANVINALIYPAFLVAAVLASLLLLLAYVVPQFVPVFADMQVPIPWITRCILSLGEWLQQWSWLAALLLAAGMAGWRWRMREAGHRRRWHARLLALRVCGPLYLKLETARLSRSLGTLLHHGVSLLMALQVAGGVVSNQALLAALRQVGASVRDGGRLGVALEQTGLFPALAVQMVQVGEEAGQLDSLLLQVADTYEAEARLSIDRLLSALVPALTLVMTVLVALVMAAILLPLLSLTSHIQ